MRTRCATGLRYSPENLSQPSKHLAMPAHHGHQQPALPTSPATRQARATDRLVAPGLRVGSGARSRRDGAAVGGNWLDQAATMLDFHSPRHAAESGPADRPKAARLTGLPADRLRLEGLLRQLEYQSALPAEHGGRPIDTTWLRTQPGHEPLAPSGTP